MRPRRAGCSSPRSRRPPPGPRPYPRPTRCRRARCRRCARASAIRARRLHAARARSTTTTTWCSPCPERSAAGPVPGDERFVVRLQLVGAGEGLVAYERAELVVPAVDPRLHGRLERPADAGPAAVVVGAAMGGGEDRAPLLGHVRESIQGGQLRGVQRLLVRRTLAHGAGGAGERDPAQVVV